MRLPSSKLIALFIVCLSIVVVIIIMTHNNTTTTIKDSSSEIGPSGNPLLVVIQNSTSTEENTLDNFKPLTTAGWQDGPTKILVSGTSTTPEWTMTDSISREIFARYLTAKAEGTPIDDTWQNDAIQSVVEKYTSSIVYKKYSTKNISVAPTETVDSIKLYGNLIGQIILTESKATSNELTIAADYINTQDVTKLSGLDPIISGYKDIISSLLSVSVPPSAASLHITLVNSLQKLLTDIEGMKLLRDDMFKGMISISQHKTSADETSVAIKNLGSYFTGKGISYEQGNYGYVFQSGI